jgi:hypothetical protein
LLRGACHRARVRATRWLAMTGMVRRHRMLSYPPTGRPNGRPMTGSGRVSSTPRPIDSVTDASGILGVRSSRTMTLDVGPRSRGAMHPRFARKLSLEMKEGAGNAGCALHPRSRVQTAQRKTHTSIQVQRKHSGIPRAMVLRLMPCSPRRRIRLVTVVSGSRLVKLG